VRQTRSGEEAAMFDITRREFITPLGGRRLGRA
jgi:hypothetical protein